MVGRGLIILLLVFFPTAAGAQDGRTGGLRGEARAQEPDPRHRRRRGRVPRPGQYLKGRVQKAQEVFVCDCHHL